jgi:pimeloyl-ACP methyl ester carboxylesterase
MILDAIGDWVGTTHARSVAALPSRQKVYCAGVRSVGELRAGATDGTVTARSVVVKDEVVFGILRRPDGPGTLRGLCVIYETGNPGQRVDIHRCGPVLAERLAAHGLASFRYDPRGMGTSLGNYQDMTWSRRVEDLSAVMDSLGADGYRSIVILGNSAGARVGLRAAADDPRIAGLVLWGPILCENADESGEPNLIRVPGGVATEWCGLPLGLPYQRDVREYDYVGFLARSATPTCVIFAEDEPDQDNLRAVLGAVAARSGVSVHTAPGQHGFTWSGLHEAIDHSIRWIQATVARAEAS